MSDRKEDSERSGEGSSGIPRQDGQDLSTVAGEVSLITSNTEKSTRVVSPRVWMLQTRSWSIII